MKNKFNKQSNWWACFIAKDYVLNKNPRQRAYITASSHKFLWENYKKIPTLTEFQEMIKLYVKAINSMNSSTHIVKNVDKSSSEDRPAEGRGGELWDDPYYSY